MGFGLVLLPTLAIAVIVRGVMDADRAARAREVDAHRERLEARASHLATALGRHAEIFPREPNERFSLGLAHPELENGGEIDGSCEDWRLAGEPSRRPCQEAFVVFDRAELLAHETGTYDRSDFSFALLAARREAYLHLFVRVADDQIARRGGRFDRSDHLRLVAAVPREDGESIPRRFVVDLSPEGKITTYQADAGWQREVAPQRRVTWGDYRLPAYRRPYGRWRQTPEGYEVELRLPLRTLGPRWRKAELGFGVRDVDIRPDLEAGLTRKLMWFVPQRDGVLAPAAPDAERFQAAVTSLGLGLAGRQLAIFDARSRELYAAWPESGAEDDLRGPVAAFRSAAVLEDSPPQSDVRIARKRIEVPDGRLLGFVIERDRESLVTPNLRTVLGEVPLTLAVLAAALLLLFLLLGYTRRISARILALTEDVGAERDAGDEIGALSRTLSELSERDREYRSYLENLPRTLRHEVANRLSVPGMVIHELPVGHPHRGAAERAIRSVAELVDDLGEATSLEEALERGELVDVDLVAFVREFADAYREAHGLALEVELPSEACPLQVIEHRVEQLLEKLLDNARDFSGGRPVTLSLECAREEAILRVTNTGSQLPHDASPEQLFSPMSSWRKRTPEGHLGLGLHVARLIAEQHGGSIRGWNAGADKVVFEVRLRRDRDCSRASSRC